MSESGSKTVLTAPKRHFRITPRTDIVRVGRHVSNVPTGDMGRAAMRADMLGGPKVLKR